MNLRNNVQLIGHLGADPIVKEVNKTKVANFSVAVNDYYKPKGSFINVLSDWDFLFLSRS